MWLKSLFSLLNNFAQSLHVVEIYGSYSLDKFYSNTHCTNFRLKFIQFLKHLPPSFFLAILLPLFLFIPIPVFFSSKYHLKESSTYLIFNGNIQHYLDSQISMQPFFRMKLTGKYPNVILTCNILVFKAEQEKRFHVDREHFKELKTLAWSMHVHCCVHLKNVRKGFDERTSSSRRVKRDI